MISKLRSQILKFTILIYKAHKNLPILKVTRHNGQGEHPSGVFIGAEALPQIFGVVNIRSPDLPQAVGPHTRCTDEVRHRETRRATSHTQTA